jgi:signal peptidase I
MFDEEIRTLKSMRLRDVVVQSVTLGLVVCSALVLWEFMMVFLNSESPVVVVLSGSMEPGYYRGDLLLLNLWKDPIQVGDVVVFKQRDRDIPIVHRVHRVHVRASDGEVFILTKGDNNNMDDRALYPPGVDWISERDLMGRSKAYLPYVGFLTIWMSENSWMRFVVIGLLGFFVITGKEEQ